MTTALHLDDLAAPRLPLPVRLANLAGAPLARRLVRLDPARLIAAARARERADDLGDRGFEEPLAVLCAALEEDAALSAAGRLLVRELLLGLLASRLRLEALLARRPELAAERVAAPLVVLGLPRTGTTHLHTLLSLHPALRTLPYWESLEPIPSPRDRDPDAARRRRCQRACGLIDWMLPHLRAMHELAPQTPHEEIQLLAMDLRTMLFEVSYQVPAYAAWYRAHDQAPAYRYLARVLGVLQGLRGPRRWALKSPQHLEQLPALLAAFPDARVVQLHRDPVEVTASFCTMIAYAQRMNGARVDPHALGAYWSSRVEGMLAASVRDRARLPADRFLDVRFEELVADGAGTAERVLAFAGLEVDAATRAALARHQAERPRHAHGRIEYRLADVGLDAEERRAAFGFYRERFGV